MALTFGINTYVKRELPGLTALSFAIANLLFPSASPCWDVYTAM